MNPKKNPQLSFKDKIFNFKLKNRAKLNSKIP